jgi:hypothetical protein
VAEKNGDDSTGRDSIECTDEKYSGASIRDGVPGRDEGYGASTPVAMFDVFMVLSTYLARNRFCAFAITEMAWTLCSQIP